MSEAREKKAIKIINSSLKLGAITVIVFLQALEPRLKFNRDLKIEVFRHFRRTADLKKSSDQCVAVRFAV